jgi:hypothetical protein
MITNIQETKKKLDDLLTDDESNIKRIPSRKDGLIERIRMESQKKIITEDNKQLLRD